MGMSGSLVDEMETEEQLRAVENTIQKRRVELRMQRRARALAAVVEQLCDASKYPVYAAFHDVLRSTKCVDLNGFPTLCATYEVGREFYFFGSKQPMVFTDPTRQEVVGFDRRYQERDAIVASVDLRTFPARVIAFLYAMKESGVSINKLIDAEMNKNK